MKKIIIFLMSFFLIFAIGCGKTSVNQNKNTNQEQETQEKEAAPAVDFELSTLSGERVKLTDLKGKNVVLNFFTTTCPYCIKEMPWFIKTAEKYADKDFVFLFIDSGEGKKAVNTLIESKKYKIDPLLDETGDVFYNYGLRGVPSSVFVDKNSNIYNIHTGLLEEDDLKSILDEMINK